MALHTYDLTKLWPTNSWPMEPWPYMVMAYIFMAYIIMAYTVMAFAAPLVHLDQFAEAIESLPLVLLRVALPHQRRQVVAPACV